VSDLLSAELLKLRTTRTFAAFVASALGLSLLVVVLVVLLSDFLSESDARDLFTADFSALFILLLGVMGMAGEWRHRTITSTILAAPDRIRLLAAKTIAYAVAGAVLSLIVTVAIMFVGSLMVSAKHDLTVGAGDLADVLWRNLTLAALLGALGVGIGGLLRNQVVGIVGVLVLALMVEPTVMALEPDVGRFGPTSGAPNGIQDVDYDDDLLTPGAAIAVMLGWIAVFFAAAGALLRRRDLV
jgi:ABC-2 type transport system permease protein